MPGAYATDPNFDRYYVLQFTISLVIQTVFYGIYAVFVSASTHILLAKSDTRSNRVLFLTMSIPFTLSSLYWILQTIDMKLRMQAYLIDLAPQDIYVYTSLFNAVVLLNYVSSDAIVVWRAWVLCRLDYKKWLFVPSVLLILTSLSVFATIGIRIYGTIAGTSVSDTNFFARVINTSQFFNQLLSLLTNLACTSIISHKTWLHRRLIREGLTNTRNSCTRAESILLLLIESGFLYCLSAITTIFTALIRLPFGAGTVGDIYFPVSVQISGIYPTVVIVLVGLDRSLNHTTFRHVETAEWKGDDHGPSGSRSNIGDFDFSGGMSVQNEERTSSQETHLGRAPRLDAIK